MTDIPEITDEQFDRASLSRLRRRIEQARFESGEEIAALRTFVGLTQAEFARAIGSSGHTLRNWEQGRRKPEGPAIALVRIAARHSRILREPIGKQAGAQATSDENQSDESPRERACPQWRLDLPALLGFSRIFGMGGCFISLALARWVSTHPTLDERIAALSRSA